jgi:ClpP class serine protease
LLLISGEITNTTTSPPEAHPAKVTVYVPVYAMSGGTLIALAADEIVMGEFSVLGPIDPQILALPIF